MEQGGLYVIEAPYQPRIEERPEEKLYLGDLMPMKRDLGMIVTYPLSKNPEPKDKSLFNPDTIW